MVEHFLGKEEVTGSIPVNGSKSSAVDDNLRAPLFVGEKPKSPYPVQNPDLNPEQKRLFGITIPVVPVRDLLISKLNSSRPKNVVHLEVLEQVGSITTEHEESLPGIRRNCLETVRQQFDTQEDV